MRHYVRTLLDGVIQLKVLTHSLSFNASGWGNVAQGVGAGRHIADGSTGNSSGSQSLFLGLNTRALANGQTNQIVIGATAIGAGSNSVVLGNDSILTTVLKGTVLIGPTGSNTINTGAYEVGGIAGLSGTYNFGGGITGDVASMAFTGGILTGVTTVP